MYMYRRGWSTYSLAHSPTSLPTYSLTYSHNHSPTSLLTHSLAYLLYRKVHEADGRPKAYHSGTSTLTLTLTLTPTQSLTRALTLTLTLTLPLTLTTYYLPLLLTTCLSGTLSADRQPRAPTVE